MRALKLSLISAMAVGGLLVDFSSQAEDLVALNVTGEIIASPCQIASDSVTKSVNLGDNLQSANLQTAPSATPWVPFTLELVSCPQGTRSATVTMHGNADSVYPEDRYLNSGTANNIAVQVQSQAGDPLGDGKSLTGNIVSGAYTYNLRARAYSQNGHVTSGTISAVVTATFTYQ